MKKKRSGMEGEKNARKKLGIKKTTDERKLKYERNEQKEIQRNYLMKSTEKNEEDKEYISKMKRNIRS
jgi:hypothetical protein